MRHKGKSVERCAFGKRYGATTQMDIPPESVNLEACLLTPGLCRMPEQLTGVIERITFHNEDNGYCVLRVAARGHRDVVTVVGHCQQVVSGEYITATGDWVTDRSHGRQFKATELKTNPPHTAEGIAKYLGSG